MKDDIRSTNVAPGTIRLWWLGQAGFVFKTRLNRVIYIDPYLSDAVERLHGFKRLTLPPIAADHVKADLVVLSHEHTDHLDPDALPIIARKNPHCLFAAPAGCLKGLTNAKIKPNRQVQLDVNRRYDLDGLTIYTAAADHGEHSPTALAFVLDFNGVRVLFSGDTSLSSKAFQPMYDLHPSVLIPCINGTFGNMNHLDAARMASESGSEIVIPCHFWTFAEQGGDPGAFVNACKSFCPDVTVKLLKPGEGITCKKRKTA